MFDVFLLASSDIYHVSLKGDNSVTFHWTIDYNSEEAAFEIHLPSEYKWFAFGFSDRGDPFPADYCLLWQNRQGKFHLQVNYLHLLILPLYYPLVKLNRINFVNTVRGKKLT